MWLLAIELNSAHCGILSSLKKVLLDNNRESQWSVGFLIEQATHGKIYCQHLFKLIFVERLLKIRHFVGATGTVTIKLEYPPPHRICIWWRR